ncbi:MAG: sugar phosphate nucleotidyltransferase [Dissulfuribacterales bacterium]
MKALILSAGQGRRLMPYTAESPKCTVPVLGRSMIEWQIDALFTLGINRITVVVGYKADFVKRLLTECYGQNPVKLLYNPEFAETNNLVSCWAAHKEMNEDFILINGDTLFDVSVPKRLLEEPVRPVTVTIDHKEMYDADDMKVTLDGKRLINIGKDIAPGETNGEAIGMILFRGKGPAMFSAAIENALTDPMARKKYYLSVIREMSRGIPVQTCSIQGLNWCEIDYPADLKKAEKILKSSAVNAKKPIALSVNNK